jgi:hypothetical protein
VLHRRKAGAVLGGEHGRQPESRHRRIVVQRAKQVKREIAGRRRLRMKEEVHEERSARHVQAVDTGN